MKEIQVVLLLLMPKLKNNYIQIILKPDRPWDLWGHYLSHSIKTVQHRGQGIHLLIITII